MARQFGRPSVAVSLLDHGYIHVCRVEGDDQFLAETARTSTESTGTAEANARLVTRLIRDEHTSPIEFGGFVFQIKAPLFVARQWMRHRSGVFNEFSGRYSEFPDKYYVPELDRVQVQSTFNKQGSAETLPVEAAEAIRSKIIEASVSAYEGYRELLSSGLTRELARIILPVNFYTVFRWRVNLHNLFHFLRLREDPHAQWEIRVYANAIHDIVKQHFPAACAAFEEHIQGRITISPQLANWLAMATQRIGVKGLTIESELKEFIRRYSDAF